MKLSFRMQYQQCILILLLAGSLVQAASRVKIESNGYSNLVVAFHSGTSSAEGEPLIEKIKNLFTSGSRALYTATRKRSYFKEITILVPKSWPKKPEYKIATFETFAEADVQIKESNPMYGDGPYTLQPMGCGNPGTYIHITPSYLRELIGNSTVKFGDPGKTLVHEWAHLRYGIFDEYPDALRPGFQQFYYDADFQEYLPNACTNQDLVGKKWNPRTQRECLINPDGSPEQDCVFIVDPGKNKATSSIASYHYLPHVETFCDDTEEFLHNRYAPNMQNRMCVGRSTWSVIAEHEDFKNKNPAKDIANPVPSFTIVQQEEATYSLVLDISSSMNTPMGHSKLNMLQEAATRWLKEEVKIGSSVGIVTFSSSSTLNLPILKIENEAIRNQVISKVPTFAGGYTCIGCGLRTAITDLKRFRGGSGGVIVLLSDGEENRAPYVKDVLQEIKSANVRVITIAFTAEASGELEKLADATGGKTYFVPVEASVVMLDAAFHEVTTHQSTEEDLSAKIAGERHHNSNEAFKGQFIIDMTIGRDTAVNFLYNDKSDILDIKITGPGLGTVSMKDASTDAIKIELNDKQKQVRFVFKQLKAARYRYVVERKGSPNQDITVNVVSKSKTKGEEAITTECTVIEEKNSNPPKFLILAEVKKGSKPVINAKVLAKVDRPNQSSVTVQLMDNGRKGDIYANDGIYSGYFTQFVGKGRYSIQANVVATHKTAILETGFTASRAMPIYTTDTTLPNITDTPTGEFERIAVAGSIQLTEDINTETTDIFPPSAITDLQLVDIKEDNTEVVLEWSAPGDDLENGQASEYDVRYTMDYEALRDKFHGQKYDNTSVPLPAGETETLSAHLIGLGKNIVYFVAVKTKDKAGNWSKISNIVEVRGR